MKKSLTKCAGGLRKEKLAGEGMEKREDDKIAGRAVIFRLAAVFILAAAFVLLVSGVMGCAKEKTPEDKVADLEFTVVPAEDLPEELKRLIEEKKENEFKLSYSADGFLYIAAGFGTKETGGYSVNVKALYLTENAIVMDSDLIGPGQEEDVSQAPSFPYIVIRTEDRPESIVFR